MYESENISCNWAGYFITILGKEDNVFTSRSTTYFPCIFSVVLAFSTFKRVYILLMTGWELSEGKKNHKSLFCCHIHERCAKMRICHTRGLRGEVQHGLYRICKFSPHSRAGGRTLKNAGSARNEPLLHKRKWFPLRTRKARRNQIHVHAVKSQISHLSQVWINYLFTCLHLVK
jgi:hypothetical protein